MTTTTRTAAPAVMEERDAIMAIAIGATFSDGKLQEAEVVRLRMLAYLNPMYETIEHVDDYISTMLELIQKEGWGQILDDAVAVLPQPLRETAYAWAAEITYCDGKMHEGEHIYLRQLRSRLGVHGELARKIQAVTGIRNRSAAG